MTFIISETYMQNYLQDKGNVGVGLGFEIAQKGYRNRFHSQHGSPTGDWISQIGQDNVYWVFLYGCRGVENSGQVLHSSLQNI